MSQKRKIAIIGAGASGLTAIKCCLDEGLDPVCFETADDIGGLWRYTEEVVDGQACVAKSTVMNTSKEMSIFSDFPAPKEFPNLLHNTLLMKYFRLYVERFDLAKHIRFKTSIKSVKRAENYNATGKWILQISNVNTLEQSTEIYDAVLVCTGHFSEKHVPHFSGLENFKGKILHSHDFKHASGYEDKNVLIVGLGNSAADAAVEISKVSKQIYLSTRRGSWIFDKVGNKGVPFDLIEYNRFHEVCKKIIPGNVLMTLAEYQAEKLIDHEKYSLKPQNRIFQHHFLLNGELPYRIICGAVQIRSDIKEFTTTGVEFVDGSIVNDIDIVLLATGYNFRFPFLDDDVIDVKENNLNLYKHVWNPDLNHPTMAFIGLCTPLGGIIPILELQCRWATSVFKGDIKLASKEQMLVDIKKKRDIVASRYVESLRNTTTVEYMPYMDELAELAECKPDMWKLFKADPKFAIRCFFGPCLPYQYRLFGRNAWPGAKEAILTMWERVDAPLKTRPTGNKPKSGSTGLIIQCLAILLISYIFIITFGTLV
ncbi:unnamed protein product [Owenia fusiformis]|uniref:Flavin-containing monooxygenase n=1 Tax=Owenia fusiformis TaxID=6347 RepID=A0A8J1UIR0_OWEFU|nr:unnamed protein product [Owenia fusiformis]